MKAVPKLTPSSQNIDYRRELEAIAKFSQTKYEGFFVRSFGWYEDAKCAYIAMEYFELGDLQNCLSQPLPEWETQQVAHQLLEGLEQLHLNGYAHRDLKPANVFVVRESPDWWVKIGDFGISKRVNDRHTSFRTTIGTPGFIAPEILQKDRSNAQYTAKVDMWSLGVLIHYMITKTVPFPDTHKLWEYMRTCHFPSTDLDSYNVSKECQDFVINALMATTAAGRLSASDALQHKWLGVLYTSGLNGKAKEANRTQYSLVTEHINGRDMEMTARAGSASLELTDASASWGRIETESQISIRIKHEVARGPQSRSADLQQSTSLKGVPISHLHGDLHTSHDKGLALLSQQQYSGAQEILRQAVELRKNAFGTYHEDTLASLAALGDARSHQGKYAEAEVAYRQAWEGRKKTLGTDHKDTLDSLDDMGEALASQEKYNEAEAAYRQAWEGRKETLGTDHEDTLYTLHSLGNTLLSQGKSIEAEVVYRQVWEGRERTDGINHEDTLASLHDLGKALKSQEKYTEAEATFREAWEGRKKTLGVKHEHTLVSYHYLGVVLNFQNKHRQAEGAFRGTWRGRIDTLGANDEDTLNSLHCLGLVLDYQGKYAKAEGAFREAWERRRETLGTNDENTLISLQCLGETLASQGKYIEAEATFRQAWEGRKETLGVKHEDTLKSLHFLGRAFLCQENYIEAETTLQQAWTERKETLGVSHVDTISSVYNLATVFRIQSKHAKAEAAFREAWKWFSEEVGANDELALNCLNSLGEALHDQGKFAEAKVAYRQAWEGRKQTLGADHQDTLISLRCLQSYPLENSPSTRTAGKNERSQRKGPRPLRK